MPSGGTAEWRIMKRMKNQQITALLLALALALAGCAGSGTAAQSAEGSTTGAAAAAVENSDSVADVQEEASGSQNTGSAPKKTDPAGKEGLLDFSGEENDAAADPAGSAAEGETAAAAEGDDDSRAMAASNQVQKAERPPTTWKRCCHPALIFRRTTWSSIQAAHANGSAISPVTATACWICPGEKITGS